MLEDTYEYLESRAQFERHHHHVFDRLNSAVLMNPDDVELLRKMHQEAAALSATIYLDEASQPSYGSGSVTVTIDTDYVRARLEATQSEFLRVRYAAALWRAGDKHTDLGWQMVRGCFELLRFYRDRDRREPQEHWGLSYMETLQTAALLSAKFGLAEQELRDEVVWALRSYPRRSSARYVVRIAAADLALEHRFGRDVYESIRRVALNWGPAQVRAGGEFQAIRDTYRVGRLADRKLGRSDKIWHRKTAEAYEHMAVRREAEVGAVVGFLWEAAQNYRLAGDNANAERLELQHNELKGRREFQKAEVPIDISDFILAARSFAEQALQGGPTTYYSTLAFAPDLVPRAQEIEAAVDRHVEEVTARPTLFSLIPLTILDMRGNVAASFGGPDEYREYNRWIRLDGQVGLLTRLVEQFLCLGANSGVLTSDHVVDLLYNSTWMGRRFDFQGAESPAGPVCWAESLAPGITVLTEAIRDYASDRQPRSADLICAIDSVVVKVEGVLRQVLASLGKPTTKRKRGPHGEAVQREVDLDIAIANPVVRTWFGEDNYILLQHIFVSPKGPRLRHEIAHSLLPGCGYEWGHAFWLLVLVIRLAARPLVRLEAPLPGG